MSDEGRRWQEIAPINYPGTTQKRTTETLRIKFTKRVVTAVTLPPGKDDQIAWNINLPTCGIRMRRGRESISNLYRSTDR
jgi:hypothetical protein